MILTTIFRSSFYITLQFLSGKFLNWCYINSSTTAKELQMTTEQTTPENLDSVMRRIAKLLAIAGDDRANPEEASAAAGMAERIMREYQLEHADVIVASLKAGNDMAEGDCVAAPNTNETAHPEVPTWASILALQIAKANDCRCKIPRPDKVAVVRFYGFDADVKVAVYMFNYLVATVNRLVKVYLKTDDYAVLGRASANSYRLGVTTGISSSLRALTAEKAKEVRASSSSTSLMVIKAQLVAERFGEQKVKYSSSTISTDDAYSSGICDGKSVNVSTRGVTGSSSSAPRLGC
jgi:hypothetical protein